MGSQPEFKLGRVNAERPARTAELQRGNLVVRDAPLDGSPAALQPLRDLVEGQELPAYVIGRHANTCYRYESDARLERTGRSAMIQTALETSVKEGAMPDCG
jgi:hypothetical protein